MREIILAGKKYKIQGDIVQRAINPWIAKVGYMLSADEATLIPNRNVDTKVA